MDLSPLKNLQVHTKDGQKLILLKDIVGLIKNKITERDSFLCTRSTILRVAGVNITIIDGIEYLDTTTVIVLFANISSRVAFCKKFTQYIGTLVFDKPDDDDEQSNLNLYNEIGNHELFNLFHFLSDIEIPKGRHLHQDLQITQSNENWRNILLFEYHFDLFSGKDDNLHAKIEFWNGLQKVYSTNLNNVIKETVSTRANRRRSKTVTEQYKIWGNEIHLASFVEDQLMTRFSDSFSHIVVLEHKGSMEENSVDLVVSYGTEPNSDVYDEISAYLGASHCINIRKIIVLDQDEMSTYFKDNGVQRLTMQDSIYKNPQAYVIIDKTTLNYSTHTLEENDECQECFGRLGPKECSLKEFQPTRELYLNVPLHLQLHLLKFLNKNSLRQVQRQGLKKWLADKHERMYFVTDVLLNTFNQKHIGILQEGYADRLALNCNITNVFDITQRCGVTLAQRSSERGLKMNELSDKYYYDAYVKRHPLIYDDGSGESEHQVRMRDCYILFSTDNLVRLRYHKVHCQTIYIIYIVPFSMNHCILQNILSDVFIFYYVLRTPNQANIGPGSCAH